MVDHKFNGEASPKYYVSAPTTPIHTGASTVVIPFDWELTPGTPKHSITRERFDEEEDEDEDDPSMEFAFQFNARKEEEDYFSVTADELFEKGKILPLKPPPCLHQYKVSPSLTSPRSPLSRFFFRGGVGGGGGLKAAEKESDPFEKAIDETTRGRDRDRWLKSGSGRPGPARSLSPSRKNVSSLSTNVKKWRDLLLFRTSSSKFKGLVKNKGMSFPVVKNSPVIFGKYSFQNGIFATTTSSEKVRTDKSSNQKSSTHRRGVLRFLGFKC